MINPKLRKLIIACAQKHAWNIGVSNYRMDIAYAKADKKTDDGEDINGEMLVDRRYLAALLTVFPSAIERWKKHGDESIEELVAHEVSHIATAHLFELATTVYKDEGETKDAWESLTETIARLSLEISQLKTKA